MEVKQDSCQLKSEVDSELTKVRHFGNYLVYFILTHFQEPPQEGISSNLKSELELTKVRNFRHCHYALDFILHIFRRKST